MTESGQKTPSVKELWRSLLVPATTPKSKRKRSQRQKQQNDFFVSTLSGNVSNDGPRTSEKKRLGKKKGSVQSL